MNKPADMPFELDDAIHDRLKALQDEFEILEESIGSISEEMDYLNNRLIATRTHLKVLKRKGLIR